jgi:hypothetical protein
MGQMYHIEKICDICSIIVHQWKNYQQEIGKYQNDYLICCDEEQQLYRQIKCKK